MSVWRINGGRPICGTVRSYGSKNAALPIIAAAALCPCRTELLNCPCLRDVETALDILRYLGCRVEREGDAVNIDSAPLCRYDVPESLMREMRASVLFMGALAARTGRAVISRPGGCKIGERPTDIHFSALRGMGYDVAPEDGSIVCTAGTLAGGVIRLPYPSVGATENAMIAACAVRGETTIRGAAREPEISALGEYLTCMGAELTGLGTDLIRVHGFHAADRVGFRIPPDRIVTATQLCAAAACGGSVIINGAVPHESTAVTEALSRCGCETVVGERTISLRAPRRLSACGLAATRPYPGFPTDAQPLLMAACLRSAGASIFVENIFENRFMHVPELRRMGASIQTEGRVALVTGVPALEGAHMRAVDLRGGAALMIAALSAEGESFVADDGEFISRGYEDIAAMLAELGADIIPCGTKG